MRADCTEADLATRDARDRLEDREPLYWHEFAPNCFLGYYKSHGFYVWTARFGRGKRSPERRIAAADDVEEANGLGVMSFEQARSEARNWCAKQVIDAASQPIDDSPFMTAGPACGRT